MVFIQGANSLNMILKMVFVSSLGVLLALTTVKNILDLTIPVMNHVTEVAIRRHLELPPPQQVFRRRQQLHRQLAHAESIAAKWH